MIGLAGPVCRRAIVAAPLLLLPLVVSAAAQEKIVLDGATGVLPLARALTDAYQQRSPNTRIEVGSGLGTAPRLQALSEGRIQIAVASHGINADAVRGGNLTVVAVAKGAVVFAVNQTVSVSSITDRQVCAVYGGEITTWSPLGGGENPIAVLTRPPEEVDPEVIRAKLPCFRDLTLIASARVMPRGGDMAKGLAETPYALGMTSMTVVAQSGGRVKALELNGVAPTTENVRSGRYVLTRDFFFVVKGEPTGSIRKFLDFVQGPDGERIILANGAVPAR
jgi:phosphate transport system substrate-binding protein